MSRVKDAVLFTLIHDFFKIYLPGQRQCSNHTIKSYRDALGALLDFVKLRKKIELHEITFAMIDSKLLSDYLDNVEEKGCGISTRNHRRNCIRAFYKYAAKMEPTAVIYCDEIYKIPKKNAVKPEIISHMSEAAVKAILEQPDASTNKGLRDRFFMMLLYDTGARIQEIMDARVRDVRLGATPIITLHGKGNKIRSVPLMQATVRHYLDYRKIFHAGANDYSEQPLFYVTRNGENNRMHHDTARRFIHDYGVAAKARCHEVPDNVHPHLWRHTRAMHLYQHGMDLTLVSQWLGHSKLETTLIYARADTEKKRKAIELATNSDSPLQDHLNSKRYTVTDEELLKRLYGLR